MYWIAGGILLIYIGLFCFAKRKVKGKSPPGVIGFFYPMAVFLYRMGIRRGLPIVCSMQVEKDLRSLYPGEKPEQLREDFYVKKISLSLLLGLAGVLLGIAVTYSGESRRQLCEGTIMRGTYAEASKELEISTTLPSGQEKTFQVIVYPQKLSGEEIEALYYKFISELPEMILGKNSSLEQVRTDLELMENYKDYPFWVEWKSNCPDVLSSGGKVYAVERTCPVILTAIITYEEWEWRHELEIIVLPILLSEEESVNQEIADLLEQSENASRNKEEWNLPKTFRGAPIIWKEVAENNGPIFLIGAIAIAILIFLLADTDLHKELLEKREHMKRAYPDVVQKLLLYLGAGLTVRGAFQKMASEYEDISYMCRELQAGISEVTAYEHWGRRIGVQEYLRLSTLLAQNLKKGNSTLLQRLREEAERACEERLQYSRKLGEEATTKLLLPMILLLVVVMLMIMLPAFSSMGM